MLTLGLAECAKLAVWKDRWVPDPQEGLDGYPEGTGVCRNRRAFDGFWPALCTSLPFPGNSACQNSLRSPHCLSKLGKGGTYFRDFLKLLSFFVWGASLLDGCFTSIRISRVLTRFSPNGMFEIWENHYTTPGIPDLHTQRPGVALC